MKNHRQAKIKIVCDYSDGYYKASTYDNDGFLKVFKKPIFDWYNKKNNYSKEMLNLGRKILLEDIKALCYDDKAPIEYCEKIVNESDPIVYFLLCDVDHELGTSYSIEYLKSIYQNIQGMFMSKEEFENEALEERINNLNCAGISIEYNTALVINNKSGGKLIDKINGVVSGIKGILLAKKQNKILGVEVHTSIKPKDRYEFINGIKNESEYFMNTLQNYKNDLILKYNKSIKKQNKKVEKTKVEVAKNNVVELTRGDFAEEAGKSRKKLSLKIKPILSEKFKPKKKGLVQVFRRAAALAAAGAIAIGFSSSNNNNFTHSANSYGGTSVTYVNKNVTPSNEEISKVEASTIETSELEALNEEVSKAEARKAIVSNNETSVTKIGNADKKEEDKREPNNKIIEEFKRKSFENVLKSFKTENDDNVVKNNSQKTEQQKIEEFKKEARKKYLKAFVIGEKPGIGDALKNMNYSANNDGSGLKGCFINPEDYISCFINFFDNQDSSKFLNINANGEILYDLIEKYGEKYPNYSIAYENVKTGGIVGFTNDEAINQMIENEINKFISQRQFELSNIGYDNESER